MYLEGHYNKIIHMVGCYALLYLNYITFCKVGTHSFLIWGIKKEKNISLN